MTTVTLNTLNPRKVAAFELYKNSYASSRTKSLVISSSVVNNRTKSQPLTKLTENKAKKEIFVRRIFILALVMATFLAVTLPAAKAFGRRSLVSTERPKAAIEASSNSTITVVVKPGDTLWSIARRIEPNKDPRSIVDQLVKARGTTNVMAGETIQWSR